MAKIRIGESVARYSNPGLAREYRCGATSTSPGGKQPCTGTFTPSAQIRLKSALQLIPWLRYALPYITAQTATHVRAVLITTHDTVTSSVLESAGHHAHPHALKHCDHQQERKLLMQHLLGTFRVADPSLVIVSECNKHLVHTHTVFLTERPVALSEVHRAVAEFHQRRLACALKRLRKREHQAITKSEQECLRKALQTLKTRKDMPSTRDNAVDVVPVYYWDAAFPLPVKLIEYLIKPSQKVQPIPNLCRYYTVSRSHPLPSDAINMDIPDDMVPDLFRLLRNSDNPALAEYAAQHDPETTTGTAFFLSIEDRAELLGFITDYLHGQEDRGTFRQEHQAYLQEHHPEAKSPTQLAMLQCLGISPDMWPT